MRHLLRRKVGYEGPLRQPLVRLPADFARSEGFVPGDEIALGWEGGLLVVCLPEREAIAVRVLESLRVLTPEAAA